MNNFVVFPPCRPCSPQAKRRSTYSQRRTGTRETYICITYKVIYVYSKSYLQIYIYIYIYLSHLLQPSSSSSSSSSKPGTAFAQPILELDFFHKLFMWSFASTICLLAELFDGTDPKGGSPADADAHANTNAFSPASDGPSTLFLSPILPSSSHAMA